MEQISVSQLLHNSEECLRRAGAGEQFEITRHGEPLALLGPLPDDDDPLGRLVKRGIIEANVIGLSASLKKHPPLPASPPGVPTLTERLADLRRDER